jgi:hypothetical protein
MSTKEQSDIRKKLKILNHGRKRVTYQKPADILAFPERLIISGKEILNLKVNPH